MIYVTLAVETMTGLNEVRYRSGGFFGFGGGSAAAGEGCKRGEAA